MSIRIEFLLNSAIVLLDWSWKRSYLSKWSGNYVMWRSEEPVLFVRSKTFFIL